MKLLLDTHILLWWANGDSRLNTRAKSALRENECFVSAATWWELSIKKAQGRVNVDFAVLEAALSARAIRKLDMSFAHAKAAGGLPPIHGDPFDRMLIAQAQVEGMQLLTHDKQLKAYGPAVLFV